MRLWGLSEKNGCVSITGVVSETAAQHALPLAALGFPRGEADVGRAATPASQASLVQVQQVSSELLPSKCIDKGVEAAVGECNSLSHIDGQPQSPLHVAAGKHVIQIECV